MNDVTTIVDRLPQAQQALSFSMRLVELVASTLEPYKDLVEWKVEIGWNKLAVDEFKRRIMADPPQEAEKINSFWNKLNNKEN
jgi:hypothetical protein